MGADRPKQYLTVLNETILQHTLKRIVAISSLNGLIVTLAADDHFWGKLCVPSRKNIITVTGGSSRSKSILSAIEYLRKHENLPSNARIMVHDSVRPCVRTTEFENLIERTKTHAVGGLLVSPKDAKLGFAPESVVSEAWGSPEFWYALTPQIFRLEIVYSALTLYPDVQHEAAAVIKLGLNPLLIFGHPDNIKVTLPSDLGRVERYLHQQSVIESTSI